MLDLRNARRKGCATCTPLHVANTGAGCLDRTLCIELKKQNKHPWYGNFLVICVCYLLFALANSFLACAKYSDASDASR